MACSIQVSNTTGTSTSTRRWSTSTPPVRYRDSNLAPIHPPKRETFDIPARTNTDPKGVVRTVDVYTVRSWGLYMARPTPGRPQFHYLESWLLPSLGLRATVFHFNPGHEKVQDVYLDVGEYTAGPDTWYGVDHYVDLVTHRGVGTDVLDVDELMAAVADGQLAAPVAERAVMRTITAVEGLTRNGHDLNRWLSGNGMDLTWRGA